MSSPMKLPLIVVFAVFSNSKFAGSPERSMPTPVSDAIGGAAAREMRLHPPSHCGDEANGSATVAPMTVADDRVVVAARRDHEGANVVGEHVAVGWLRAAHDGAAREQLQSGFVGSPGPVQAGPEPVVGDGAAVARGPER